MYLKEITHRKDIHWILPNHEVSVTYEGQDVAEVTRDLTVKEQVKKQAFQLIKISEDGEQTETDLVAGARFKVYLISDLTQVKMETENRPMEKAIQQVISRIMTSAKSRLQLLMRMELPYQYRN